MSTAEDCMTQEALLASEIEVVVRDFVDVSACDAHHVEYDMFSTTQADAVAVVREDDSDVEETLRLDVYERCPKVDWKTDTTQKIFQNVKELQRTKSESIYISANLKKKEVNIVPVGRRSAKYTKCQEIQEKCRIRIRRIKNDIKELQKEIEHVRKVYDIQSYIMDQCDTDHQHPVRLLAIMVQNQKNDP